MRKYLIAGVAAAALAAVGIVGGVALAESGAQGASAQAQHHGMFARYDANGDGVITRAEFDAARQANFDRLDTNHDGSISRDELHAGFQNAGDRGHWRHGGGGRMREMMLQREDSNHDGSISRDEFLAGPIARFNQLDANHDGVISADELAQARAAHDHGGGDMHRTGFGPRLDGDGVITRAEYQSQGDEMFQRLDANHDGRITQDEMPAPHHWRRNDGDLPPQGDQQSNSH